MPEIRYLPDGRMVRVVSTNQDGTSEVEIVEEPKMAASHATAAPAKSTNAAQDWLDTAAVVGPEMLQPGTREAGKYVAAPLIRMMAHPIDNAPTIAGAIGGAAGTLVPIPGAPVAGAGLGGSFGKVLQEFWAGGPRATGRPTDPKEIATEGAKQAALEATGNVTGRVVAAGGRALVNAGPAMTGTARRIEEGILKIPPSVAKQNPKVDFADTVLSNNIKPWDVGTVDAALGPLHNKYRQELAKTPPGNLSSVAGRIRAWAPKHEATTMDPRAGAEAAEELASRVESHPKYSVYPFNSSVPAKSLDTMKSKVRATFGIGSDKNVPNEIQKAARHAAKEELESLNPELGTINSKREPLQALRKAMTGEGAGISGGVIRRMESRDILNPFSGLGLAGGVGASIASGNPAYMAPALALMVARAPRVQHAVASRLYRTGASPTNSALTRGAGGVAQAVGENVPMSDAIRLALFQLMNQRSNNQGPER